MNLFCKPRGINSKELESLMSTIGTEVQKNYKEYANEIKELKAEIERLELELSKKPKVVIKYIKAKR